MFNKTLEMKIDITPEENRFQNHLDIPNNNQIIFSGIFGIGKTYFLKEFFKKNSKKHELFLLSPVNYSISNNDDIIDYIKYDIAFELLRKNIDFEKTDFSSLLTSQFYLKENFLDTITLLAKGGGKIGKTFSSISENLKKLANNIKEHNSDSQIDEKKELIDFLREITTKEHSIFEENRITELISGLIEKTRVNNTILVIDDLDRLDPEHIFRILNVFACHFDLENFPQNKFGFDKIILVCDIDNIRRIFSAKYGQHTDFSGYIDKFFSYYIFFFNNKLETLKKIPAILHSVKCIPENHRRFDLSNINLYSTILLEEIIKDLINVDALNLRSVKKIFNQEYRIKNYHFILNNLKRSYAKSQNYEIILVFDFLVFIYGGKESLKLALDKISKVNRRKAVQEYDIRKYSALIQLINYKDHEGRSGSYHFMSEKLDLYITYQIENQGYDLFIKEMTIKNYNNIVKQEFIPYSSLLIMAFEEYSNIEKYYV